jgi:hypothetical protein
MTMLHSFISERAAKGEFMASNLLDIEQLCRWQNKLQRYAASRDKPSDRHTHLPDWK